MRNGETGTHNSASQHVLNALAQVIFTGTPGTAKLQQNLSLERLCAPADWAAATTGGLPKGSTEQGLGKASCRVCYPFQWGGHQESGRIQLSHFFRLVSQYHKADVPFYVFEADIGGCEHNKCSYGEVDSWSGRPPEARDDVDIRHTVAQLYQIPAIFGRCHLVVSEWCHIYLQLIMAVAASARAAAGCCRRGAADWT